MNFIIRQYQESDSIEEITELLHRAYGALKEKGMNYLAASQGTDVTASRIHKSYKTYLALNDDKIIATISLYKNKSSDGKIYYHQDHVMKFGQFAVEPSLQGQGIGHSLIEYLERQASLEAGVSELALDTSERADHLITYYKKRGYKIVSKVNWSGVNYESYIMSKKIRSL